MKNETKNNQVQFLLDGKSFFAEIAAQLDRVAAAEPGADTYVRMAFWSAKSDCRIDFSTTPRDLKTMLRLVADAGHSVQFICWRPDLVARLQIDTQSSSLMEGHRQLRWAFGMKNVVLKDIDKPKKDLDYQSANKVEGPDKKVYKGSVRVYMETYDGWFFGASTHQKIAIFSVKGELTVIVGGFNLESGYYATTTHCHTKQDGSKIGLHWHDTAVKITGPATIAVEQEWLRRWRKQFRLVPSLAQASLQKQPTFQQGSDISILTTNSEKLSRETDIRKSLCERIASANYYVYLENYVLSDPVLVSALAARLRANKDLVVIFVTGRDDDVYSYLNRMSLVKLVIAAGGDGGLEVMKGGSRVHKSFDEYFTEGKVIEGNFANPDLVDQLALLGNPFMAKDEFQYKAPGDKATTRVALGEITGASSFRVRFCYPDHDHLPKGKQSLYVHSKLVVIDDDTAFIGSANLSYRSMVYDGEICARISGDAARDIRVELFKHYNIDLKDAAAIQKGFVLALMNYSNRPDDEPYLKTCHLTDFSSQHPGTNNGNHTWH